MAQGTIFTANDAANYLKKANKNYLGQQTWLKAYDDINKAYGGMVTDLSIAAQQQGNAALQDFSDSIANAYDASLRQRNQVLGSNLGQGFKTNLLEDNEAILDSAYNSYLQKFLNEKSNIGSNLVSNIGGVYQSAAKDIADIDEQLAIQAQYTADYLNAHFDYLQELYNRDYKEGGKLFASPDFYDYIDYSLVGGVLRPGELKDMNTIRQMMFDPNGELNERGVRFFNQMENYGIGTDFTFSDYLYNANKKLYDWSVSTNPYDTTYTDTYGINTNRVSALEMVLGSDNGVVSTNYTGTDKKVEDFYYQDTKFYEEANPTLGKINVYNQGQNTVQSPIDSTAEGLKDRDNENFHIKFTDSDGKKHTYNLELAPEKDEEGNAKVVDDTITTRIDKLVGGIENGKLYYENGILYVGIVDGDKKKLRVVQGQGGDASNGDYKELTDSFK